MSAASHCLTARISPGYRTAEIQVTVVVVSGDTQLHTRTHTNELVKKRREIKWLSKLEAEEDGAAARRGL